MKKINNRGGCGYFEHKQEQFKQLSKELLKEFKQKKKLWKKIQKDYPQLAEDVDFHILKNKCLTSFDTSSLGEK